MRVVEEMDGFGRELGIAFQIADDLLDVLGEERTTGKSLGTDLEKQKPTLPILRVLQVASATDRQAVLDILHSDERQPALLVPYLERYEAIEYARKQAMSYSQRARRRLEGLPRSEAGETLAMMTEFVVCRSM